MISSPLEDAGLLPFSIKKRNFQESVNLNEVKIKNVCVQENLMKMCSPPEGTKLSRTRQARVSSQRKPGQYRGRDALDAASGNVMKVSCIRLCMR